MSRWKKDESEITDGALYMREWAQTDAGIAYRKRHTEVAKEWRKNNPEKFHATQRRAYKAIRLEALQHYSGKDIPDCRCCGESMIEFLHFDHIKGDGASHRLEIGMRQGGAGREQKHKVNIGANGLPYWLKKNGWPEGFQVLCANCNLGKDTGKYCPHELKRGVDLDGNTIPSDFYPQPIKPMPIHRSPERTAWLESPEGYAFKQRQSETHLGKMVGENHPNWTGGPVEVPCTQCGALLKRKQCEIDPNCKSYSKQFFCNMKCSGAWKKKNLVGDKVYNTKPSLEFECPTCQTKILRKQHQLRPGQTKVFCNRACADAAKIGKPAWNKGKSTTV
jgi:hypothetical protein